MNKKYKEPSVHFVEKLAPGGLIRIKKKQPTIKQIIKQLSKTGLHKDECLSEFKTSYSNDYLILIEADWAQLSSDAKVNE